MTDDCGLGSFKKLIIRHANENLILKKQVNKIDTEMRLKDKEISEAQLNFARKYKTLVLFRSNSTTGCTEDDSRRYSCSDITPEDVISPTNNQKIPELHDSFRSRATTLENVHKSMYEKEERMTKGTPSPKHPFRRRAITVENVHKSRYLTWSVDFTEMGKGPASPTADKQLLDLHHPFRRRASTLENVHTDRFERKEGMAKGTASPTHAFRRRANTLEHVHKSRYLTSSVDFTESKKGMGKGPASPTADKQLLDLHYTFRRRANTLENVHTDRCMYLKEKEERVNNETFDNNDCEPFHIRKQKFLKSLEKFQANSYFKDKERNDSNIRLNI